MPIRLFYPLAGDPPAHPFQHGTGLRAVVLHWIQIADPDLSSAIHDGNGPKPYSISPIWQRGPQLGFELALLDDDLLGPVLRGLMSGESVIRLGAQRYRMGQPQMVRSLPWEDLFRVPADSTRIELRLCSPTAHHAPGPLRKSVVLPSPELYFGSWFNRFNGVAEEPLSEEILQVVQDRVAISACAGSTASVRVDDRRIFIGFQGDVRFQVIRPQEVEPGAIACLWALARFGDFSGTGVETMRGMGQTQLLSSS